MQVGDRAPDFSVPGTLSAGEWRLSDRLRERRVVLAFFPLAFTGG